MKYSFDFFNFGFSAKTMKEIFVEFNFFQGKALKGAVVNKTCRMGVSSKQNRLGKIRAMMDLLYRVDFYFKKISLCKSFY